MRFVLEWTESALEDLNYFRKYEQTLILDRLDIQLAYEPGVETRNRKPIESTGFAEWELRIGNYRVFYDISADQTTVKITAIGSKEHNVLYIRGKEYVF
jgi:mRNA-degrading endonuclease RelE of RelBE toxin-antitoxin system